MNSIFESDGSDILNRVAQSVKELSIQCTQLNAAVDRLEIERFTADSYTVEQLDTIASDLDQITKDIIKILNGEMF